MAGQFDREGGRERADASARQAGMRLNGVAGAPAGPLAPGGPGGFGSTPADKTAAASTIETELQPNTKTAAEHADETTDAAGKGFDGRGHGPPV